MAIPNRDPSQNKYPEQYVLNTSYDETYGILATELVAEDTNVLRRLQADSSGNLKVNVAVGGGGGTQYTEADTDTTITGTAIMWEDASDTLRAVSAAKPLPVDIQDSTIAVTQSGTWDEVGINDSGNSITVDNGGTFAVQVDGAALTSLQLIDDSIYTDGTGTVTKGIAILGQDGTNPQAIKTDTSGELQVDVLTMPTVTVTATNLDVQSGGADLATTTQAASIQTAVELIDDAVFVDDTATHSTGTTKGVGIMGVAVPTDTSISANDIGMFAMSLDRRQYVDATLQIADADVSTTNAVPTKGVPSDIDINGSNANHAQKYYTNAGAVTDGIIWSPASGKRWHILSLYINVSAAATVTLEDDLAGGDSAVWKGELAANSGVILTYDKEHPFSSTEDAADLIITTSAGNVYVQAVGYEV